MKKLDEIPKNNIFEVPDGYFEKLPMRIQARVEAARKPAPFPALRLSLRYALPVIVAGLALFYFLRPSVVETEEVLASISSEHLIAFLDESDLNENELLEVVNFDEFDADSLNQHLNTPWLGTEGEIDREEFKSVLENEL